MILSCIHDPQSSIFLTFFFWGGGVRGEGYVYHKNICAAFRVEKLFLITSSTPTAPIVHIHQQLPTLCLHHTHLHGSSDPHMDYEMFPPASLKPNRSEGELSIFLTPCSLSLRVAPGSTPSPRPGTSSSHARVTSKTLHMSISSPSLQTPPQRKPSLQDFLLQPAN